MTKLCPSEDRPKILSNSQLLQLKSLQLMSRDYRNTWISTRTYKTKVRINPTKIRKQEKLGTSDKFSQSFPMYGVYAHTNCTLGLFVGVWFTHTRSQPHGSNRNKTSYTTTISTSTMLARWKKQEFNDQCQGIKCKLRPIFRTLEFKNNRRMRVKKENLINEILHAIITHAEAKLIFVKYCKMWSLKIRLMSSRGTFG